MKQKIPVPIISDGSIFKILLEEGDVCRPPPEYKKNTKVSLHYKVFTIPLKEKESSENFFKSGLALVDMKQYYENDEENENAIMKEEENNEFPNRVDPNKRLKVGDSKLWNKKPLEFLIGRGFSIEIFEIAVKTMKIGERSKFFCLPKYAESFIQLEAAFRQEREGQHKGCLGTCDHQHMEQYQALYDLFGCPLEFEIELLSVQEPDLYQKEIWDMQPKEKYQQILDLKNLASDFAGKRNYQKALEIYEKSIGLLELLINSLKWGDIEPDNELNLGILNQMKTTLILNQAACQLNLKQYTECIQNCTKVLNTDSKNEKALFRRAKARSRQGRDLDSAQNDFISLRKVKPDLEGLEEEFKQLQMKLTKHEQKQNQMYKNILK